MPNEFDGRALFEELRERANKIPTPPGVERIGTLMQQTSAEGEPSFYSTERHGGNQLGGAPVKRSWPGPPEWDGLLRLSADRGKFEYASNGQWIENPDLYRRVLYNPGGDSPDLIGRELAEQLAARYGVKL